MDRIRIHEVGPRDGLQAESAVVPADVRMRWIQSIIGSGIDIIQLGSFINPQKVPQMSETDALFRHFSGARKPGRSGASAVGAAGRKPSAALAIASRQGE